MDLCNAALCPCPSPAVTPLGGAGEDLDTQQRQEVSAHPGAGQALGQGMCSHHFLCALKFKQRR